MNKILLVIQREFLTRVRKRSFLVATILIPLIIPAIIGSLLWMMKQEAENAEQRTIHVLNQNQTFKLEDSDQYNFVHLDTDLETAKIAFKKSEDYALLYIPDYTLDHPTGFVLYAKSNPDFATLNALENDIEGALKEEKLKTYKVERELLEKLKTHIELKAINLSEGGEQESSAGISFGIGYFTGFLIYIFMFAYGGQVMHGVIEEKSSKIVEVILSTVKPFQLMTGKILGVAAVGFFQIMIWIVLITILSHVSFNFFGLDSSSPSEITGQAGELLPLILALPFFKIIMTFIFYFIGGFFLYGSLFAAAGSAVDSPSEAQQFMIPIMIPLLAGIVGMSSVISNPNGDISFWLSMIPFTSPIAMMGRIGFGVPLWQLLLSMALLVAGFVVTTWIAARIYRIGILMHGTKVNYKVLAKWFMMKH